MNDFWNNPPEADDQDVCSDCGIKVQTMVCEDKTVYTCPDCGKQWVVPHDPVVEEPIELDKLNEE